MSHARYNITIHVGSKYELDITWRDENEVVVPMGSGSGYTARMQVRREQDEASELLLDGINTTSGYIILANTAPNMKIRIPATVTATLEKSGWFDVFVVPGTGEVDKKQLFEGKATRDPRVTV